MNTWVIQLRGWLSLAAIFGLSGLGAQSALAAASPDITIQPASQSILLGSNVIFTVVASGQATLFYQWTCNGTNMADNAHISGATNVTLTVNSVTGADAGNYQVTVSNSHGSVVSSNAALTVLFPAEITTQPANQAVLLTSNASFTVMASGTAPLSCQWYFNSAPLADGGRVNGSSTTNLNLANVQSSDGGLYQAVVTNNYSSTTSAVVLLTVLVPPTITNQPAGQVVLAGGRATFRAGVAGTGPLTYQWQLNGTNVPFGIITTIAGNGTTNFTGDGAAATNAGLYSPVGVAVDTDGNIFIGDGYHNRVRKIDYNGIITTVAGDGGTNYSSEGIVATNASVYPSYLALDNDGNLFMATEYRIRKVDTNGIIQTVAGKYGLYQYFFDSDGGAATNTGIAWAAGISVDDMGNFYFVDGGANCVRKVNTNGIITTIAGKVYWGYGGDGGLATNAYLFNPRCIALDEDDSYFIADSRNNRIRKVDPNGIITTVAGNGTTNLLGDGRAATNASLNNPSAVAVSAAGELFIADGFNNRVRKVDLNGIITTVVGNGTTSFSGDGGVAADAGLFWPSGLALDARGDLLIADSRNNRIRKVVSNQKPILALNNVSAADAGNYQLVVTSPYGSVTSSVVAMTVLVPPTITNQPAGQVVLAGGSATFTAGVAGTGPFSYQWQLNGTNVPFGIITTIAGNGTTNFLGDGDAATNAGFRFLNSVAVDASGNVFIGDSGHQCIRKVDTNGIITTMAGNGGTNYYSEGIAATNASLYWPSGLAVDASGNLFVSTANRVRKIDTSGIIRTVAGTTGPGSWYSFGDGGPATNAGISAPGAITADAAGNLFVTDGPFVVRKVDTNGIIMLEAGNYNTGFYSGDGGAATNAGLYQASGLASDTVGNLYIADSGDNRIRKVDLNGIITTVAGNGTTNYSGDGIVATNTGLNHPIGVAMDASGSLFVSDSYNNCIRKVGFDGIITTVAGNGTTNFSGDGGVATDAGLFWPSGLALDARGDLLIADYKNNRIRKVVSNQKPVLTLNNVGALEAGNYQLVVTSPYGSVTSSVVAMTVVLPPQYFMGNMVGGSQLSLQFSGTPNYPYILQSATNLTPPVNWQPVLTNPADANGNWQFTDTNLNGGQKFYRTLGQ